MDSSKDNMVDDSEWIAFYDHFVSDFQGYDTDVDFYITEDQVKTAF